MTVTREVAPRGPATALAQDHASLIVYGQDRTGIVAAVGSVLTRHGANIVSLDQYRRGELPASVAMVISNHADTAEEVRSFGIPFFHVPSVGPDKAAAKSTAEAEHLRLQGNVDFIVLARYMQILSGEFIAKAGADVERTVLSRAVQWHSEDRVIRSGNHTIVFA